MEKIIYNYDNIDEKNINNVVTRVKVILKNSANEILVAYCQNIYQFPGGHLEENETLNECVKREIKEETGILLENDFYEPFYAIEHFNKDYPSIGINTKSIIYYYLIDCNCLYNLDNINLTDREKQGGFKLMYINLDSVIHFLETNLNISEKNKIISGEMIKVLNYLNKNDSLKV